MKRKQVKDKIVEVVKKTTFTRWINNRKVVVEAISLAEAEVLFKKAEKELNLHN
ncbi:MAG TPA: hypothetical protein PLD76_00485 [Paludibacteraceae bacterium]|nr:hypothetical protein [Paludibacteraceae bacterium]